MLEGQLKRLARNTARGVWWILTPWKLKARIDYLRARAQVRRRAAEWDDLIRLEGAQRKLGQGGQILPSERELNLFDPRQLARVTGLPAASLTLSVPAPQEVADRRTAAAFVLGLWRDSPEVRERFGKMLRRRDSNFLAWLREKFGASLPLSDAALEHIANLFDHGGVSARARQVFLAHTRVRELLPHGLTPPGAPSLFRWFARVGMRDEGLGLEEVIWLFVGAAQDPAEELLIAHAFTPAWQKLYPDGTTVFGREAFSSWFADEYGASGPWLEAVSWPDWESPASQIRTAYWARASWRAAHPDALAEEGRALALLAWLATPAAALSDAARAWCAGLNPSKVARELVRLGANVIGHFCYASGLRVSVESLVQGMARVGVSASLRDVRTDVKDDPHHVEFRGMECHEVTIIHTQPEPFFRQAYELADLFERSPRTYRIGYWYWEFDSVPDAWAAHGHEVDEVWTATEFVAKGLREKMPVPVRTMFPGVKLASYEKRSRADFGVDAQAFTFLFTFHMMSVMERKNPLGLIRAFKQAFREEEAVRLVLKTSFGDRHPVQIQELRDAAAGANITVIDQVYSPDAVLSLMDACDAYVSLHRSEGLGLTMAEAMLMGKPVIATNFSGNVDFMDESNSLLVPYELVKLGKPIPPYDADLEWAEPSVEHAAQLMRRVYDNQAWARELGARAKASAEANLSLEAAGRRIAARLEEIKTLRRRPAG